MLDDDLFLPIDHELEITVFDDRNRVVSQFDCVVTHFLPDIGLILATDDDEEANILLYEYQDYELEFINLSRKVRRVELEWETIDPLRMVLFDAERSPAVRTYEAGGVAWGVYENLNGLGRFPTTNELCIRLKQDNYGYLSRIGYVPRSFQEQHPITCYCKGTTGAHLVGAIEDCEAIIKTTRRLEYNPFLR